MGNPHATEAEMLQALRTACADFVLSLPDGIDTNLNEQGGGLSEGQAQRIAIARALLRPGHILLLDEATSALDPETERQLIKNLRRDCTGKTFIFITHHPAVAEACEATYTTLSIHLAFISPSSLTAKDATFCITPRNEPDHIKASNR